MGHKITAFPIINSDFRSKAYQNVPIDDRKLKLDTMQAFDPYFIDALAREFMVIKKSK